MMAAARPKKSRPKKKSRKRRPTRVTPKVENGISDESAPYFQGDTAEKILESRQKKSRKGGKKRRKRSKSSSSGEPHEKKLQKTLRRLERNLPKRKTLAARQRLAQRIKDLKKQLGETD